MKSTDLDILIIPGLGNSGPGHWQTRWEEKMSTTRLVAQDDWDRPNRDAWVERIVDHAVAATRPIVFVTHSLGAHALAHAVPHLGGADIRGAFLVVPPAARALAEIDTIDPAFLPVPAVPLPFTSLLVASRNDAFASYEESAELAQLWGSELVDAGESGHLNLESGHGPWPEGLMRFAGFLKNLA